MCLGVPVESRGGCNGLWFELPPRYKQKMVMVVMMCQRVVQPQLKRLIIAVMHASDNSDMPYGHRTEVMHNAAEILVDG